MLTRTRTAHHVDSRTTRDPPLMGSRFRTLIQSGLTIVVLVGTMLYYPCGSSSSCWSGVLMVLLTGVLQVSGRSAGGFTKRASSRDDGLSRLEGRPGLQP